MVKGLFLTYLISPPTPPHYPTPAKRPSYSTLDTTHAENLGVEPLPDWRQSLPGVVGTLGG